VCVIIDANVAPKVFSNPPAKEFQPVLDWLVNPRKTGCVVYGGRLTEELQATERVRGQLVELSRAGRARQFPNEKVNRKEKELVEEGLCISDDPHIIALAIVSGARTLCSHDRTLHKDFRNKNLVSDPRGHVYQKPSHKKHLCHTESCGGFRVRRGGSRRR